MIRSSVISSMIIGVAFGFLYALFTKISAWLLSLFKRTSSDKSKCGIIQNVFDFLFITSLALIAFLSQYVFLDGVLEIYTLMSLIITFAVSVKLFSELFSLKRKH